MIERGENRGLDDRSGAKMVYCQNIDVLAVFGGFRDMRDDVRKYFFDIGILDSKNYFQLDNITTTSDDQPTARTGHYMELLDDLNNLDKDACWVIIGGGNGVFHATSSTRRLVGNGPNDFDPTDLTYDSEVLADMWIGRISRTGHKSAQVQWVEVSTSTSQVDTDYLSRVGSVGIVRSVTASSKAAALVASHFGDQDVSASSMTSAGAKSIKVCLFGGALYENDQTVPTKALNELVNIDVDFAYTSLGRNDSLYSASVSSAFKINPLGGSPSPRFAMSYYKMMSSSSPTTVSKLTIAGGRSAPISTSAPGKYEIYSDLWEFDFVNSRWSMIVSGFPSLNQAYGCAAPVLSGFAIFGGLTQVSYVNGQNVRFPRRGVTYVEMKPQAPLICGANDPICLYEDPSDFEPMPALGYACTNIGDNKVILLGGMTLNRSNQEAIWELLLETSNFDPDSISDEDIRDMLAEAQNTGPSEATVGPGASVGVAVGAFLIMYALITWSERRRVQARSASSSSSRRRSRHGLNNARGRSAHPSATVVEMGQVNDDPENPSISTASIVHQQPSDSGAQRLQSQVQQTHGSGVISSASV